MTRRYYASHLPAKGGIVTLDDIESHHAVNVMRSKPGEVVTLFDGIGNQSQATIESIGRREVICKSEPRAPVSRENKITLTIGIAMPKGDRSKELVERLTELGVNRLVPLHCQRTQWPVPENAIHKWQRLVVDACKQCERNHLMEISRPRILTDWLSAEKQPLSISRFIAHPEGADPTNQFNRLISDEIHVVIGPEGGFSDAEVNLASDHGWERISLGSRIYRIETAAILATIKLAQL